MIGSRAALVVIVGATVAACGTSPSPSPPQAAVASVSPQVTTVPGVPSQSPVPSASPSTSPSAQATKAHWKAEASGGTRGGGAVVLQDGRVLIVGRQQECYPSEPGVETVRSEIWDPTTGRWSRAANRTTPRYDAAIALLADGRVLLAGGWRGASRSLRTVSIYDPRRDVWLPAAPLLAARSGASAVTLRDGRVLVLGGGSARTGQRSVELYDPRRDAWTAGPPLPPGVWIDSVLVLGDGRVLVLATADEEGIVSLVFDPHRNTWSKGKRLPGSASWATGVPLPDGGALLLMAGNNPSAKAYRLDPSTLAVRATGSMLHARSNYALAALADGRVLVAGGATKISYPSPDEIRTTVTRSAEIYDPVTGRWSATASMPSGREGAPAVTLRDGSVLVLGGDLGLQGGARAPMCPEYLDTVVRYLPGND
jgi:hypothetical protein